MRKLIIAGVTGSIGRQAIDVLTRVGDLEVVAVGAGSDAAGASELAQLVGCERVYVEREVSGFSVPDGVTLEAGPGSLAAAIVQFKPDLVLNAVVGFAGLGITRATIESGADLALANKESLVAGGEFVTSAIASAGVDLIPVDSEHAALAQLLADSDPGELESVTLTASGGPFRGRSASELEDVSVAEALEHPTWSMGGKISIDSATLMNKGLEVIEAQRLFGLSYEQIRVVVHPQSIVHALVSFRDGVQTAHLGLPDMRGPIAWALSGRKRPELDVPRLDLASVGQLDFEEPDLEAFPCLELAFKAGRAGGTQPAVLNAANEVAVEAFLNGEIGFGSIATVVAGALAASESGPLNSWSDIDEADSQGRALATVEIMNLNGAST